LRGQGTKAVPHFPVFPLAILFFSTWNTHPTHLLWVNFYSLFWTSSGNQFWIPQLMSCLGSPRSLGDSSILALFSPTLKDNLLMCYCWLTFLWIVCLLKNNHSRSYPKYAVMTPALSISYFHISIFLCPTLWKCTLEKLRL
jgi:hypothetical protein